MYSLNLGRKNGKGEVMEQKKEKGNFMEKLATVIVDKRNFIFLVYIFACVFCLFSMNWTVVENDITKYLSEETETRQGIDTMNEHFASFATARIMISNITYEDAKDLYDEIVEVDGITMVDFNNTESYYKDANAMMSISFEDEALDAGAIKALDEIKEILQGYDVSYDTVVGYDENADIKAQMTEILMIGVVIIFIALILTSTAYMEVPVLLITFGAAALLNVGTNFVLGKISFISDSIAVVLQLALAIDYAIILAHRFSAEHEVLPAREACIKALAKAIPEISSSSLTTVSGLAALGFMEFGVGLDMAIVLIKAVLLSLLSVFTLMPGVLMLMCPWIDKTKHKKLLPDVSVIGRFCNKTKKIIVPVFCLILIGALYLSSMCPYCYSYNDLKTANMSDRQIAYHKINDVFGTSNMVAILVPTGNYEAEATILKELEACEEVNSCMGLANTELMDGYVMTDALTPREFSEVLGVDYEVAQLLYSGYIMNDEKYGQLLSVDNIEIPLFDMFCFLKDTMDESGVVLEGDLAEMTEMLDMLDMAREQLQTEEYSRMVVYLNLPEEGEETYAFLDKIHEIADKFYSKDVYVLGNSTSSRDLAASFVKDNTIITVLSIVFVIAVLLFTFRSLGLPILLIIVIQGSIWMNFSFPTLMNQPLYFLGYLIVNAIQMGANIDYAIVISSHYREEREHLPVSEAIAVAVNKAFPTVMTSGTIMASTGLLIGSISTQPVTAIMGECIGRGTIISMFLVLFVLPGILIIGDKIIERTTFEMKGIEVGEREETGTMLVKGHVRGYVSGVIDAEVDGVLHGRVHAVIATGGTVDVAEEDPDAAEKAKAMFLKDTPNSPIAEEEGGAGHE